MPARLRSHVGAEWSACRAIERGRRHARDVAVTHVEYDLGRRCRLHVARERRIHGLRGDECADGSLSRHDDRHGDRLEEQCVARHAESGRDAPLQRAGDERHVAHVRARGARLVALGQHDAILVDDEHPFRFELLFGLERLIEQLVAQMLVDE